MRALITAAIVLSWPTFAAAEECDPKASPKQAGTVGVNCAATVIPGVTLRNRSEMFWPERASDRPRRVPRFYSKGTRSARSVNQLTIHETANNSMRGTALHFHRHRLGVHFVIDRKGRVSHHNDLTEATQHDRSNDSSVGIELVNWIYVAKRRRGQTVIGRWTTNAPRHYLVPTLPQVEALHRVASWLTSSKSGLSIPRVVAGIVKRAHQTWFTFSYHQPVPLTGVRAHGHMKLMFRGKVVGRSDGFFPTLYLWLRWNTGLTPKRAYRCAKRITNGARLRQWTRWKLFINDESPWEWKQIKVHGILGNISCHGGRVSG